MSERSGRQQGGHGLGRMPVEKAKHFKMSFRRLLGYLKPQGWLFALVFVLAILSTLFSILGPKIMGMATTELAKGILKRKIEGLASQSAFDFDKIGWILSILLGLYLLSALFTYVMGYVMSTVAQNTVYTMRNDVKLKLDRLPLKYYDSHQLGDILSRMTNDLETIATSLQQSMTQIITSLVSVVGILMMMLTISPVMTLIALLSLPLSMWITLLIAKRSQSYFVQQQKQLGELNGHVEEMLSGHLIIKAFGHERSSIERFKEINQGLSDVSWKAQFMSGIIFPALGFINNLGYVVICVFGGLLVAKRSIAIGDIQAFIQYIRQFTHPIAQIANISNVIQSTIASAERVFDILDASEESQEDKGTHLRAPIQGGNIVFSHVQFGYNDEKVLMKDLNLVVESGHTVAIVGPTGAGKTTLVNLLMRFYEIQKGSITLGGIDTRDMPRGILRRCFGMVLQDTWLFNGTIRENIAYGREDATEAEILYASEMAHAHHFICTLPEGYQTVLNEEASNISQGQKQLITIARAILANPPVLILDEATSNVDTRTEVLIQKAMANLMAGRTSFVIAHRLSTIRDAELILVMDEGNIVEQGNHPSLIQKGGFYAALYNSQFESTV